MLSLPLDSATTIHLPTSAMVDAASLGPLAPDEGLSHLKRKWGIYELGDLRQRCERLGTSFHLVEGLTPCRSLSIIVGDSGLGKSPLLYQMGLCIASGTPFLGNPVRQGRVLYLDFENGLEQVEEMTQRMAKFLGLEWPVANFVGWNANDCPSDWGRPGRGVAELIRDVRPEIAFIDPVAAPFPVVEKQNADTQGVYQSLRSIVRDVGCAIALIHHIRKPLDDCPVASIEDGDLRRWFEQARGPRALINGADVRLGIDLPGVACAGLSQDIALVMGGFRRVRGSIPLVHLTRVLDEDGEPLAYRRVSGPELLPVEQRSAYERLPEVFRFKEARQVYGKGPQATTDWLAKCQAATILRHDKGRGVYEKCKPADQTD